MCEVVRVTQIVDQATVGRVGSVDVFTQSVVQMSKRSGEDEELKLVQDTQPLQLEVMRGKGGASAVFDTGEVVTF